ncbi:MAG: cutA [Proteobacteria bacterium]|nr:cutA [Pseudomonadota bacterium]
MSKSVDDLRIVTVTCPDEATALVIARLVVERRLAACANIVPGVRSVYRWMGEINEESEVIVTMKTREDFVESLFTAIVANHPYQQPAIEVAALADAGRGVAAWIRAETGGEDSMALPRTFKSVE